MNKSIFVGTKLEQDQHTRFSVIAAQRGLSRSALMKKLALDFIAKTKAASDRKAARK